MRWLKDGVRQVQMHWRALKGASWSLFYSWEAAAGTAVDAGTKEQDVRSNTKAMSRVPWHQFQDCQLRAHLVVGVVAQADGPVGGDELNAVQYLLNRLVRQQKLGGDYAATVVRETGRREVYKTFGWWAWAPLFTNRSNVLERELRV